MTCPNLAFPDLMRSWALFSHTSVPCDSPLILMSSPKVVGLVSSSIPRTNLVPNSGMPTVPTVNPEDVSNPSDSGPENSAIVAGSSMGMFFDGSPVRSSSILMAWGHRGPEGPA